MPGTLPKTSCNMIFFPFLFTLLSLSHNFQYWFYIWNIYMVRFFKISQMPSSAFAIHNCPYMAITDLCEKMFLVGDQITFSVACLSPKHKSHGCCFLIWSPFTHFTFPPYTAAESWLLWTHHRQQICWTLASWVIYW